jgi:hypothetical protein
MVNERPDYAAKLERIAREFANHLVVSFLVLTLATQSIGHAAAQQGVPEPQKESSSAQSQQDRLPDSPAPSGAGKAGSQDELTPAQQQPGQDPKPVGTAVAPYVKPTGIAASRPAGAAIAPAKQRRSHAVVIKVALIAGAAAAGGAVVALSLGSRSRP